MNKGIQLSSGKWLYFLGADDRLKDKNVLKTIVAEFNSEVDVVSGKIQYIISKSTSKQVVKNNGVFMSKWINGLWVKNTVHHQATFYKRSLFKSVRYSSEYKILGDYALNLQLFSKGINSKNIDNLIAICNANGISKNYTWSLYKEEIKLKTKASSIIFQPIFFLIALAKFLYKKI